MLKFIFAPTAHIAAQSVADVTIEAEYGSIVWQGSVYTAAHHQPAGSPYAGDHVVEGGRPSPCVDAGIPALSGGVVGLSHLDLDTIGGCARAAGRQDLFERASFWRLAAFVDVRGPHRLREAGASDEDLAALYAYWAWANANRVLSPRDTVSDVTDAVLASFDALARIFAGDAALLEAGAAFAANEAELNAASFVDARKGVIVRVSGAFTNHLYATPAGAAFAAVVAYNEKSGAITLSLAEPVAGVSCRAIAQALWGSEAGGHDGIAGSPRGVPVPFADLHRAAIAMRDALAGAR